MRHWLDKWTTWEFLPMELANIPVYAIYAWFALRARHLFFFSNANPAIPLGGAVGESKKAILDLLPAHLKPGTVLVPVGTTFEGALHLLQTAGLSFPVIAKPDVGERGFRVKKLDDAAALRQYLHEHRADFLVQEFLTQPVEAAVLYHCFPDGRFGISSVCLKEFLQVIGDGTSTVRQLMARTPRSAFQIERFEQECPDRLHQVPAAGQPVLLEPIGNHVRGTKFLNANYLIDPEMTQAFERLCTAIEGVRFGRFDLKCASLEALRRAEITVMELNGVFAEPAHVFDPDHGPWRAYRDYYRHWHLLYDLHRAQLRRGVRPTSHREAFRFLRDYFRYKKQLEAG